MSKKIVLIGAGSAQFGYGTMGDIFQSKVLAGAEIVLHDINPQALSVVTENGQAFIREHNLPFTLSATTSREEALRGADYIIISIEVAPRFDLWELDWRIPQQYGVRQVYGENGGPGGLFHALRITPHILAIADDIARICPQAVAFNFSNPMSRICTTVTRKHPHLKFIGICHEINSLRVYLPFILKTPLENLEFRAAGLNHFSFLLEAKYKDSGKDAYPDIRAKAPAFFENHPSFRGLMKYFKETGHYPESVADLDDQKLEYWPERLLFKVLLERFNYFPITTDSHFGEYVHWAYDAVDHAGILEFYFDYKKRLAHIEPKIDLKVNEAIVTIIEGIETDSGYEEAAVNIPNKGYINDLPSSLVVEVPAIVTKNGVEGVRMGDLPAGVLGLYQNQVAVHNLTAETILHQSKELALQALLVDPIVDNYQRMPAMLEKMIELQSPHLDYLK